VILLLETIKCEEGIVHNLSYHQTRCDMSRKKLYDTTDSLDLRSLIIPPKKGLYRCRILYDIEIHSIEYIPYIPKELKHFKIISSAIDYDLKYAKRDVFTHLLEQHSEVDEVIIEKNGYLTDITIANIALYDGTTWYTPTHPLLKGTMRQKLIDNGFLQTKEIKKETLPHYSHLALINAMIGFKIINHFTIDSY